MYPVFDVVDGTASFEQGVSRQSHFREIRTDMVSGNMFLQYALHLWVRCYLRVECSGTG